MLESEAKRIKELMIPLAEYPYVYDDDTLEDAIKVLERHSMGQDRLHHSLLVFSRTEKVEGEPRLVGILTIRDFFNAIQKNRLVSENWVALSTGWANFYRQDPLIESLVVKVGKAVRPLVKAYAQEDEPAGKAIELMMTKKVNIVPVFRGKRMVGIIRAIDILDYIGRALASSDRISGGRPAKGDAAPVPAEGESLWTRLPSLAFRLF